MSAQQRRRPPAKRPSRPRPPKPVELWQPVPALADPEPIVAVSDPTALLRSLGDPPLPGNAIVTRHYLASLVQRAATLAAGLAASADQLADADPDPED